jgi:hypothetical protein
VPDVSSVSAGSGLTDLGRPSYAPTALTSFFFGLFGLWPAMRHAAMARRRGLSTSGYWMAWIISWAAGGVVTAAVVIMTAVSSHDLWPNTKVVIGSVLLIGAITGVVIWDDLRADGVRAKAA